MVIVEGEGGTGLVQGLAQEEIEMKFSESLQWGRKKPRHPEHSKERMRKRERAHATRQLSMPGRRHCSQQCIMSTLWLVKSLMGIRTIPLTDEETQQRNQALGSHARGWQRWAPKQAFSVQNQFCQSQRSDLWVTDMREWKQLLDTGSEPRYPNSCLSCFIPPITKLSVENIYTETEGETLSIF